jgi:hypothetical protein
VTRHGVGDALPVRHHEDAARIEEEGTQGHDPRMVYSAGE